MVTTEAYQRRLNKASLAIRNVLNIAGHHRHAGDREPRGAAGSLRTRSARMRWLRGSLIRCTCRISSSPTMSRAINTGFLVKSTTREHGEGRAVWTDDDVHELAGQPGDSERPHTAGAACGDQARRHGGGLSGDGDLGASAFADQRGRPDEHGSDGSAEARGAGRVPGESDPGLPGCGRARGDGGRLQRLRVLATASWMCWA